jgi:BASS family bile acid:Na+ symporter
LLKVAPQTITSLVLLGTQKNTVLAAGLALTLFTKKTAVPATISTIFMLVYIIWLSFRQRPSQFFTAENAESAEKNH